MAGASAVNEWRPGDYAASRGAFADKNIRVMLQAVLGGNGVALLPHLPVNRGLPTVNWCACSHRGGHTQTVVCFICRAKGDARHCRYFMDELTTRLANGV